MRRRIKFHGLTKDLEALLEQVEGLKLNDWEEDFISGLRERYDQYGDRVKLSEKQWDILEEIANK